jgi:hypothetical protein
MQIAAAPQVDGVLDAATIADLKAVTWAPVLRGTLRHRPAPGHLRQRDSLKPAMNAAGLELRGFVGIHLPTGAPD